MAGSLAFIAARVLLFLRQRAASIAVFTLLTLFYLHLASVRTTHGIARGAQHSGTHITVAVLVLADSRKARWAPVAKVRTSVIAPFLASCPHSLRLCTRIT